MNQERFLSPQLKPNFVRDKKKNRTLRIKSSSPSEDNISESEIDKKRNNNNFLKNSNNNNDNLICKISKERRSIKETSFIEVRKGSQKNMKADPLNIKIRKETSP